MNTKHLFILIGISVIVFFSTLFNQFVGDDHVLFETNTFYTSWQHWPDLFTKKYSTSSSMGIKHDSQKYHSGSVAYRPVLSLTYFFDYSIWKLNPFGYHLDNLILHILNTVLVYVLLIKICQDPSAALFGALLFSVHPTKAEAVACIGYRADLLACFWQLLSLLAFINYRLQKGRKYWFCCLMTYFLALFTKESAVVLPVIFFAYDRYFKRKSMLSEYAVLTGLTVYYLYVYCFVFPNTSLAGMQYLGGTLSTHVTSIFWIFSRYCMDLSAPFLVVMIPPLYAPPIEPFPFLKLISGILILSALITAAIKSYKIDKPLSFFLVLFLISLIPIANIIPLTNPMAHRFLYFPSIGFMAAAGILFTRWENHLSRLKGLKNLGAILKMTLIGLCAAFTMPLNVRWSNDVAVSKTLLELYPDNIKSHLILAVQFLKAGRNEEASHELEKCIQLGTQDPSIYYLMGESLYDQPQKAEVYFKKAIEIYPWIDTPFLALGRLYVLHEKYQESVTYLERAIYLKPTYASCGYLIQAYMKIGKKESAKEILEKAESQGINGTIPLKNFIDNPQDYTQPVDIGL